MPLNVKQEYKIAEAVIFADRLDAEYDLKRVLVELDLFEDLEKNYVSGQVVIMDDLGVFDEIKIKGTEKFRVKIEIPEIEGISVEHTFNIVSIVEVGKVAERAEMYHLNLISPHAYKDQAIKISRSYTGKLEDISEAILKNHLNVRADRNYMGGNTSIQEPVRIITPYITPLESVTWLMDRATTQIGAPFYAYQTIYDQQLNGGEDVLRFGNLEYMFSKPVWNQDQPLLYSQGRGQEGGGAKLEKSKYIVKRLSMQNIQDTLKLIQEGALGSNLSSYDLFSSQRYTRHFNIRELLGKMEQNNMFGEGKQNVFDEEQKLTLSNETKTLDKYDARYINTVTSYGTYGYRNSYHDVFDQSQALNKIRHYAIKSLFNKNMIDLSFPGITFWQALEFGASGITVGDLVKIDFKNTNVDADGDEQVNKELSGTFLVHKCRNIFKSTTHEVIASVSKVADYDGGTSI